jgi:hypothetical protein
MSVNLCHFRAFFSFGKSQKSQGAKSGELGGWSIFVKDFLARKSRTLYASCAGALSWWRIHCSGQSCSLFFRLSLCNEFIVNYPLVIGETQKHGTELRARHACFSAEVNSDMRAFRPR